MKLLVLRDTAELRIKGRSSLALSLGDREKEVPIRDVDAVLIIGGNVKIQASVPAVLSLHNIPLAVLTQDGVSILSSPVVTRYNNYRRLQYQLNKTDALHIAQHYLEAKVQGMVNILKYYRKDPPALPPKPEPSSDPSVYERELRTWEAETSNMLWDRIFGLLPERERTILEGTYGVSGRKPRSNDPFNKGLSVMYAVLYSLATKALLAAGLDPTYGFLHRTRYSTPLTFDYVEMFRPVAIQAMVELVSRTGLPAVDEDGELTRSSVNDVIKHLYVYMTLRNIKTGKSIYQYIILKAYRLAAHLEGRTPTAELTVIWNRRAYK